MIKPIIVLFLMYKNINVTIYNLRCSELIHEIHRAGGMNTIDYAETYSQHIRSVNIFQIKLAGGWRKKM